MSHQLPESTVRTLDVIAAILLRVFFITIGATLFTWFVWLLLGDVVHDVYSQLYMVTRTQLDLYFHVTMTILKALNLIFFLFPFVAIKWYLRGKR